MGKSKVYKESDSPKLELSLFIALILMFDLNSNLELPLILISFVLSDPVNSTFSFTVVYSIIIRYEYQLMVDT